MEIKIGLQTITWGDWQNENLPAVLDSALYAGYDGIEIGYRRLGATNSSEFCSLLNDMQLALTGVHVGGNLEDRAQAAAEQNLLEAALSYNACCSSPFIMYSGLKNVAGKELAQEIERLNRAADLCREKGVTLLYHNHNWEFADGAKVMNTLLENAVSSLGFCPDIGWMYKAEIDILAFLERIRNRIQVVHFKDFKTTGPQCDTVPLGTGVVPLETIAGWLQTQDCWQSLWVIAEQDFADGPVETVVAKNATYLKRLFALTGAAAGNGGLSL